MDKPEYIVCDNGYRFGPFLICPNWYTSEDGSWFICLAGASEWHIIHAVENEKSARAWLELDYKWLPAEERLYKIMCEEGIDVPPLNSTTYQIMNRIVNRYAWG